MIAAVLLLLLVLSALNSRGRRAFPHERVFQLLLFRFSEAWKQGLGKLFLTQGSPANFIKKKTHSKGEGIDPPIIIMYVHPGTPPLNNKRKPIAPNSWLKQALLGWVSFHGTKLFSSCWSANAGRKGSDQLTPDLPYRHPWSWQHELSKSRVFLNNYCTQAQFPEEFTWCEPQLPVS